ncbi:T9SS type A sorting domain-containing protein [Winogradskyella sp.]|uniref:T9SS type A sorting domain-containing protein n=1 Tax=Winogradskyella sp. TaxID=1883156 RepID=UPI002600CB7A|nr:T9SS type A sorting domain-containing protein [Winogradskyella sp.]
MKKITLLILCLALTTFGFSQVNQNFGTSGLDSAPTVLTINDTDITVNGADPITAISLGTFTSHYNTATGSTAQCGNWYDFILAVTGGVADGTSIQGCDADFTGLDVTGFTSMTITSNDLDGADTIFFDIDLSVTFTLSSPPDCDANLDVTTDVDPAGDISWNAATGAADNYDVIVGTASGLSDVYSATLANVLTTNVGALTDGTTYYVTITPSNSVGPATGCVEQTFTTWMVPANDDCSGAEAISCGGQYTGNTTPASAESPDPGTCTTTAGTGGAVWYSFTGANSNDGAAAMGSTGDDVTLDLSASTFDTKIRVFEGSCAALVCVAGDDDGGTGTTSLLTFTTTVGTDYYVLVHGYLANAGAYTMDVSCVAPPTCIEPTALIADTILDTEATVSWTNDVGATLGVEFEFGASGFTPGTATSIASGSGVVSSANSGVTLTAGTDYDFYVRSNCDANGFSTWAGPLSFTTLTGPGSGCGLPIAATVETDCSTATPITIDFATAPNIGGTGTCDATGDNRGLWYEFTAPASGGVTISNSGASNEYVVLDACGGTELVCAAMGASNDLIGLTPGSVYKLAIWKDSFQTLTTDNFCIQELSCLPASNLSVSVISATEADISWDENNTPAATAWEYVVQAPGTGAPAAAGTATASNPTSLTGLTDGDSYEFYVRTDCGGSFSTWAGPFEWLQMLPPSNDDCSGAIALTPGGVYADNPVDGTVTAATADAEPNGCGLNGAGVWYSIVVPASGDITIETGPDAGTGDTGFDSLIEAFSGTCGSLTSIECDDDDSTGLFSILSLTGLTPASTIYVRVWESGGDDFEPFSISAYSATLGLDTVDNEAAFTYYPNPVKNTLTLNAQNTIENVTMYNMLGQEVLRATPNTVDSDLDMSNLQVGTYFVKVTIANITKTIRVIKQ